MDNMRHRKPLKEGDRVIVVENVSLKFGKVWNDWFTEYTPPYPPKRVQAIDIEDSVEFLDTNNVFKLDEIDRAIELISKNMHKATENHSEIRVKAMASVYILGWIKEGYEEQNESI